MADMDDDWLMDGDPDSAGTSGSPVCTGSTYLDESILESDNEIEAPVDRNGPRVVGTSYVNYSEDQRNIIKEYFRYYTDMLTYVNKLWKDGPMDIEEPAKPKSDLSKITRKKKVVKGKKPCAAEKNSSIQNMPAKNLNEYLKNQLVEEGDSSNMVNEKMPQKSLKEIGKYLKKRYQKIKKNLNTTLREQLDYGEDLLTARKKFILERKEKKLTETWFEWVHKETTISISYERRYRQMSKFVKDYPMLKRLAMDFTTFHNIHKAIDKMFTVDPTIREEWKK